MTPRIYFDNNASCPIDPLVKEALLEELSFGVCNPSSPHKEGQLARGRLNRYRKTVAAYFGVKEQEVIFTSSGTEAMNFLLASMIKGGRGKILTSDREHSAVYNFLKGRPETLMLKGEVTLSKVEEALKEGVDAIAFMAVNNETGCLNDIEAIGKLAKRNGIPLIVDGVALLGKESFRWIEGVSAMGFSGHKIHAPSGIGCAVFKAPFKPSSLLIGGSQEYGLRGGTENMAGIAAFAKAIQLIPNDPAAHLNALRTHFEKEITRLIPKIQINGAHQPRISNVSNVTFFDRDGEGLLIQLDQQGIAASLGSACTSGALEPSRVLLSMGLSYPDAKSSLRFSFSRMNTIEEIDNALRIMSGCVSESF
jgi:cysteine desulfurase